MKRNDKQLQDLLTIIVNCKYFYKIFTQTKLKDILYCFLLYFPNFHENIL